MSKTKKYFVENKKVILFNKKDPVFFSWFLLKFINKFMKGGQKNKVLKIMFQALSVFKKRYNINPIIVYFLVIQKIKPIVDIKVLGFGNKKFTVPVSLSLAKQYKKAVKLLSESIKKRKEKNIKLKIFNEVKSVLKNELNESIKKRNTIYYQAQRNRHLANFI